MITALMQSSQLSGVPVNDTYMLIGSSGIKVFVNYGI